jgi:hypothetical protein
MRAGAKSLAVVLAAGDAETVIDMLESVNRGGK